MLDSTEVGNSNQMKDPNPTGVMWILFLIKYHFIMLFVPSTHLFER